MSISENIGLLELVVMAGIALFVVGPGRFPDLAKVLVRTVGGMRRNPARASDHFRMATVAEGHARLLRQLLNISLLVLTAFTAAYLLVIGL